MTFRLRPLPYPENALEPAIGRETVSVHYHKHHAGYLSKLNAAVEEKRLEDRSLEQIILDAEDQNLFNVAAQVWNHDLYWESMTPDTTRLDRRLSTELDRAFGSVSGFEERFKEAALKEFGSGWAWLTWDDSAERLAVFSTTDAVTPLYDDFTFLTDLINWETPSRRLAGLLQREKITPSGTAATIA
ncbi:MAG: superoxide dismutase [Gammaproteobacteria bacterium]